LIAITIVTATPLPKLTIYSLISIKWVPIAVTSAPTFLPQSSVCGSSSQQHARSLAILAGSRRATRGRGSPDRMMRPRPSRMWTKWTTMNHPPMVPASPSLAPQDHTSVGVGGSRSGTTVVDQLRCVPHEHTNTTNACIRQLGMYYISDQLPNIWIPLWQEHLIINPAEAPGLLAIELAPHSRGHAYGVVWWPLSPSDTDYTAVVITARYTGYIDVHC
jgi:hypothetical protein